MNAVTDPGKTHFRKAFDSPYLSSADIVDPVVLTVKRVTLELDKTKKTKDFFNTCYWVEKEIRPGEALKPMILNAGNSKFMADLLGSKYIDDWHDREVEVYVDGNVRFGKENVEGLRLRRAAERVQIPPALLANANKAAKDGGAAYEAFFKGITKQQRVLLSGEHARLKETAALADDAKRAPPPDPPLATADPFVAAMDASEARQ